MWGRILFENTQLGERVCLANRGGWDRRIRSLRIGEIEKVTKTQVTAFGRRWNRRDGSEIGGGKSYRSDCLLKYTPEIQAEYESDKAELAAENQCRDVSEYLKKLRGQDAVAIAALLKPIADKIEVTQ